jgi:hypothetical protein
MHPVYCVEGWNVCVVCMYVSEVLVYLYFCMYDMNLSFLTYVNTYTSLHSVICDGSLCFYNV